MNDIYQAIDVLRVKPGDVLVLQETQHLPSSIRERLFEKVIEKSLGIRFILLPYGIEVAAVQEAPK